MRTPFRPTPAAAAMPWLALPLAFASVALAVTARADDGPPPNDGQRYVSLTGQADDQHDSNASAVLSLPVGRQAWVQAGVGQSRSVTASGPRQPTIVSGGVGVAGKSLQLTVNGTRRADGDQYWQSDVGASVDWRHPDGHVIGVDLMHRSQRAAGTVALPDGSGGTTQVPALARVSGNGVGVHGTWQATTHAGVYGAYMRSHYRGTTQQTGTAPSGGLLGGLDPALSRGLLGQPSIVNQDEAALDHSAMVGASYRWEKVAVAAEYTTGRAHDDGGALHGVALKASVDVAPGWRVGAGVGRGTSDAGGQATYASLAVTHGW